MTTEENKLVLLAVIAGLPWLACTLHLWLRRGSSFRKRAAWSLILFIPIIGPLLYGSLFHTLEPHGPSTRPVRGQGGVPYSDIPPR